VKTARSFVLTLARASGAAAPEGAVVLSSR